jgi:hypothetical protein
MKLFNYLSVLFLFTLLASCGSNGDLQIEEEFSASKDEAAIVAEFLEETLSPEPELAAVDETGGVGVCGEGYELVDRTTSRIEAQIGMNLRILDAVAILETLNLDPQIKLVLNNIAAQKTAEIMKAKAGLYITPDTLLNKTVAYKVLDYYRAEKAQMEMSKDIQKTQEPLALLGNVKTIDDGTTRLKSGERVSVIQQYCVPIEIKETLPMESFQSKLRINTNDKNVIDDGRLGRIVDDDLAPEKQILP